MAPLTRSSLPRRVKLRFVNSALPVTLKLSLKIYHKEEVTDLAYLAFMGLSFLVLSIPGDS